LKTKLTVTISLLFICFFSVGCVQARDFDSHLNSIVEPYRFSIAKWEAKALLRDIKQATSSQNVTVGDELSEVKEYFSLVEQIGTLKREIAAVNTGSRQGKPVTLEAKLAVLEEQKTALADIAESVLEGQIREALAQQSISNPLGKYVGREVLFPPLNFKLEKPPCLLVVSPRDRIESLREVLLKQYTDLETKEDIEAEVDALGVSSLVVELGGLSAVYPTFVTSEADARFTIDAAAEEWLHQYLVFKPLGFLYLLDLIGVTRNYEIATMNETLVGMVSKEIGSIVYERYYSTNGNGEGQNREDKSGFDFNREMREIRRRVDDYLARGEIKQAEEFMELKRQYLAQNGYYIRKLNQAYFAFYGTYADDPTSISPIGVEMTELRDKSASLKDFLETVAAMTSRDDLIKALDKSP